MHQVAPRTGAEEITLAEEQPEYKPLVAARYDVAFADDRPPARALLTRWRFTPEERQQLAGLTPAERAFSDQQLQIMREGASPEVAQLVDELRRVYACAAGADLYAGFLTFGDPLQPVMLQVGPSEPVNWIVAEEGADAAPRA